MEQSAGAGTGTVRTIRMLTVPQVAEIFAVSDAKIWEKVRSGAIRSIKIDNSRRIPEDAVAEYQAELIAEEAARRAGSAVA